MPSPQPNLGRVVSVHGTSPALLQRAAVVALLSFVFFLTTLLLFYLQQQLLYFLLSTAFMIIYIFTMIGWVMQKRNVVSMHENGLAYKKFRTTWDAIKSVNSTVESGITIVKESGESVVIGRSVADVDQIAVTIRKRLG